MQSPEMNLRIEMFGNLIEDLNYWHNCCDNEEGDEELQYCEQMFIDVLSSVKEMREILLLDFEEYFNDCKFNEIPVDLGYWRVKKQLEDSTFELIRS
jgi:hypothetical protein